VEEKYRHCDETLSKLLTWIGEVEDKLATQDIVQEDADDLRNQINIMKVTVLLLLPPPPGSSFENAVVKAIAGDRQ